MSEVKPERRGEENTTNEHCEVQENVQILVGGSKPESCSAVLERPTTPPNRPTTLPKVVDSDCEDSIAPFDDSAPLHTQKQRASSRHCSPQTPTKSRFRSADNDDQHSDFVGCMMPIVDSDIDDIIGLDVSMCKVLSDGSDHPIRPMAYEWLVRRIGKQRKSFQHWHAFACRKTKTPSTSHGFIICSIEKEIKRCRTKRQRASKRTIPYLEIFWISVRPSAQGRGYGRFLIQESIKKMRSVHPTLQEVCRLSSYTACPALADSMVLLSF